MCQSPLRNITALLPAYVRRDASGGGRGASDESPKDMGVEEERVPTTYGSLLPLTSPRVPVVRLDTRK